MNKPHYTCTLDTKAIEDIAEDKYNAMLPEEQRQIDNQVKAIRSHYEHVNYKPVPGNRTILGLLYQLGTYCNQNDIQTNVKEK